MKPGMKMLMMDRMQRQPESNRSEYGGGNRRMIGYDRDRSGNANTPNYAENRMEGGSMNYGGYGGENNRMEYGGGTSNYGENNRYGMGETENRRRRDSRGRYMEGGSYNGGSRNEYDEGRYGYGRNETESRRRRDSRGRYMMEGMGDDEEEYDKPSQVWFPPNMIGGSRYGFGDVYADVYSGSAINRPMGGMMAMMGGEMSEPVDEHTARKWVQKMDGGEHFKMEQADQLRASMCPDCDKYEFFVAINAMYSDHCETAKKFNMDKPEFYAMLAKDFLKDADAKPHKLRRYMETIAK